LHTSIIGETRATAALPRPLSRDQLELDALTKYPWSAPRVTLTWSALSALVVKLPLSVLVFGAALATGLVAVGVGSMIFGEASRRQPRPPDQHQGDQGKGG
jgi:hypothetical protein